MRAQQAIRPQANPHGMYRGIKSAERFDVSPPLRSLMGKGARFTKKGKEKNLKTAPPVTKAPSVLQDIDQTVQTSCGRRCET